MFLKKYMPIPLHNITIPSIISIYLAVQYLDLTGKIKKVILQHFQFYFILSTYIMSPFNFVHNRMCSNDTIEVDISSFPYVVRI